MPTLVAFASLPFGLQGGDYHIKTATEVITAHISESRYSPVLTISSRPELAQALPPRGQGEGFTSYTWYDHPFVLRVLFGRNVASLGSINSYATILRPLAAAIDPLDETAVGPLRAAFSDVVLAALNNLIAAVRFRARLYHIFDLCRDDIDISIRREDGVILSEDPLQARITTEEEQHTESFDLEQQAPAWYADLNKALQHDEPVTLADNLLMEAERASSQRFPRQAIATSHTAIEAAASALLNKGMSRRGVPDREIDQLLSTKSLTSKLDVLLKIYTGFSLKHDNHALWAAFNMLNDLRNDVAHRGKHPTTADAQFAIQTARGLLNWLELVRSRKKP